MARKRPDKKDRLEQHYLRVGTHAPRCAICNETDPRCLERHHIAGRKFHPDTILVCRNCHRKRSDEQLDHPQHEVGAPVEPPISDGRYLLGLGDLLAALDKKLHEIGRRLIETAASKDAEP